MMETLNIDSADALSLRLEIAGPGARSHAFVIDWHIRLLVAFLWVLVAGWLALGPLNTWMDKLDNMKSAANLVFLPAGLIYALYHPVLEVLMRGRTPGKNMTGIRITTTDGRTPGTGALLVRNIFRLIDSLPVCYILGLILTMTTARKVRLGDIAAGTVLVYEDKVSENALSEAAELAMHSGLSPRDQSLLLEILERWHGLDRASRISIGERFLAKIGEPVPDIARPGERDRAIHRHLKTLRRKQS